MLVDIRRLPLGRLAATVPRYVESLVVDGRPVLVSTAVPGVPMSIGYHHWTHTARRAAVARDFGAAFDWLGAFQGSTTRGSSAADWPDQVLEAVRGRWDGHPALDRAVDPPGGGAATTWPPARSPRPPCTATSGTATCSSTGGVVSGVVDWENAAPQGSPLRDVARFVLSYSLYLDRHTRPGRRVLGPPPADRASGFAPGIVYGPARGRLVPRPGAARPGRPRSSSWGSPRRSGTTSRSPASARWRRRPTPTSSAPATSSCSASLRVHARRHRRPRR